MDGLLDAARSQRVAEHLRAAHRAMAQLDFSRAIEELEGALAIDPHHGEAQQLLEDAGRQLDIRRATGWLEQARKHLAGGELELAAQLVEEAERLGAPPVEVKFLRRDLEREKARCDQAGERAFAVLEGLAQARHRLSRGDEPGAIQAAEEVLAVDRGNVEARDLRAKALDTLADRRRQERQTEQAQEVIRSARALFDQGATDLALETLALFSPEHPLVTAELASLRAKATERLRLETSRRARELRLSRLLAAATAFAESARWADAQRAASEALGIEPEHAEAAHILGEAEAALEAERQRIAGEAQAQRLVAAARAHAAAGRLEEALKTLEGFTLAHDAVDGLREELEGALERRTQENAERAALERRVQAQQARKKRNQEELLVRQALTRARELARSEDLEAAISMLEAFTPVRPDVTVALSELQARLALRHAREEAQRQAEEAEARAFAEAQHLAEAEHRARAEAQHLAEAEHRARAEAQRLAEAEHRARAEAQRQARAEAERRRSQAWTALRRLRPVLTRAA